MSLDSLPDCIAECLQSQAESIGCEEDDIQCFCEKDVSGSAGTELSSCVLSECPAEDMLSIGMDMLSFCDDIPPTDSDETTSGARTSSRSPSTATDTFSETETTSPPTTVTGENGSGGSDQSSEPSETAVSGGLSTGAKAGIGIGAALGVILLLLGAFLLGRRRRQRKDSVPTTVLDSNHHEKKGLEMEGEKWVPELDAQKNQIPAELECPSTR